MRTDNWSSAGIINPTVFLEKSYQNPRYAARYSRQSLEGTNISNTEEADYCNSTYQKLQPNHRSTLLVNNDQGDSNSETNIKKLKNNDDNNSLKDQFVQSDHSSDDTQFCNSNGNNNSTTTDKVGTPVPLQRKSSESPTLNVLQTPASPLNVDLWSDNSVNYFHKTRSGCEDESGYGRSSGNNMSVQMYRYLKHNDLKRRIIDLCKREHFFVIKQCWDEALRLREMRNDITLLKNKNIFENVDLKMDEETRQYGLQVIKARDILNKRRIRLCNSLHYR